MPHRDDTAADHLDPAVPLEETEHVDRAPAEAQEPHDANTVDTQEQHTTSDDVEPAAPQPELLEHAEHEPHPASSPGAPAPDAHPSPWPLDAGPATDGDDTPATLPRRRLHPASLALAALATIATACSLSFVAGQQHAALGPTVSSSITPESAQDASWSTTLFERNHNSVVAITGVAGSSGSGFFYRPDRIVTNSHVVASSAQAVRALALGEKYEVRIRLADGRERTGTVLAADAATDLAIVEVEDGLDIKPLALSTTTPQPGKPVAVIGHPFGQTQALTTGVISSLARNSTFAASSVQSLLLQTDAAVNPGNSGGPMLTSDGRVVGVVTLRPDTAEGRAAQGMAFALPATQVQRAINDLERHGKVNYPLLGVNLADATPDDTPAAGAKVEAVSTGSGAAKAGVKVGETVTAIDTTPVTNSAEAITAISEHQPGDKVTLTLDRKDESRVVTVTLGRRQ